MSRYNVYPEYRDSGISWLNHTPSHWRFIRFKNIFKIQKRIACTLGYDVLSITQRGVKVKDTESGDGQLSMDYSKYQLVYKDDFAMNHMDLLTGYVDISRFNGVTSPDYRVFTLNDKNQHSKYFLYLLQLCYIAKIFYPLGQGAAQIGRWRLPTEAFNEFVAPSPSYDEQRAIAAFLDHETAKIDALIEKQQRLIELLKEKRQAVISHAVTKGLNPNAPMKDSGVEWLGEVPAHWVVAGFKKYLSSIVDYRGKTPEKQEDGVFLVTARNIKNGKINYEASQEYIAESDYEEVMSRGKPKKGDLLFTTEAPLGEVASVDNEDIALAQRIIKFSANGDRLNNEYLKYLIISCQFQQSLMMFASGSTALGIKAERFVYLRSLIPPLVEQNEIVQHIEAIAEKMDFLVGKARAAIETMQERRTALISAAVTGKIDVRDWQPAAA